MFLTGEKFTNSSMFANKTNIKFRKCDFTSFTFVGTWKDCSFTQCTFTNCYFLDPTFSNCTFCACEYFHCTTKASLFSGCEFYGPSFRLLLISGRSVFTECRYENKPVITSTNSDSYAIFRGCVSSVEDLSNKSMEDTILHNARKNVASGNELLYNKSGKSIAERYSEKYLFIEAYPMPDRPIWYSKPKRIPARYSNSIVAAQRGKKVPFYDEREIYGFNENAYMEASWDPEY
jgi:hypothetical protein